ncbi:MAG: phosphoribosylanthranilate isomerase [Kofleriaceae bacterium]|nr:phosphoribosylanthranilate isomerase [Kofleriaceae bacterium]
MRDATNAVAVADAGVDFIGLNFWPGSKRFVAATHGADIAAALRERDGQRTAVVGLFVNQSVDEIVAVAAQAHLDVIQLHGDEPATFVAEVIAVTGCEVWKAVAVHADANTTMAATLASWANAGAAAVVLDTPSPGRGGGGVAFDWQLVADLVVAQPMPRLVLAGGLHAGNVQRAIAVVQPWAVDVASAVESTPGVKDLDKVRAFVAAVRAVAPT